jgi:hypothetical protein
LFGPQATLYIEWNGIPVLEKRRLPMIENPRIPGHLLLLAVIVALFAFGVTAVAEQDAGPTEPTDAPDPWAALRMLVGDWKGAIDGKLGTGRGVRRYESIMGDRYLLWRHRSVRLPQEKSPEGDQHDELGVFSYDSERETIVLREFLSEGVVVRSTCETDGMKVVCISEAVENGPGIRSRLVLEIRDRYQFTEIYEIAWPGKELEHYFTNRWTRSPAPLSWD